MAMKPVPTLTAAGWVNDIRDKCDRLMTYFFYSDYSQSNFYLGNITSLPDIINRYGNDKSAITFETEKAMKVYLLRYFDQVECTAKVIIPENEEDNRMELQVSLEVVENGVKYDLFKLLKIVNSKLVEVIDRNNSGSIE